MKTQQLQTKKMVFLNRYNPCNCLVCWKNTGPGHCLNTVRTITILDVSQGDWYQNQEGVWKSGVWSSLGSYPQDTLLGSGKWHNIWDKNLGDGLAFKALQWSEVQGQTNDLRQWVFTGRGFGAKGYTGRCAALSNATATNEFQWRDGKDGRIECCIWGREKWNYADFPVLGNGGMIVCMALKIVIGLLKCSFADEMTIGRGGSWEGLSFL